MSQTPQTPLPVDIARTDVHAVRAQLQSQTPPLLLDVREAWEFALGTLPGAQAAPLSAFAAHIEALRAQSPGAIVTYCHHGVRSLRAAAMLQQAGFANVASMDGGIDAWSEHIDASVGRY